METTIEVKSNESELEEKLSPCPFCGGKPFFGVYNIDAEGISLGRRYYSLVCCRKCKASSGKSTEILERTGSMFTPETPDMEKDNKARLEVFNLWNKRTKD